MFLSHCQQRVAVVGNLCCMAVVYLARLEDVALLCMQDVYNVIGAYAAKAHHSAMYLVVLE